MISLAQLSALIDLKLVRPRIAKLFYNDCYTSGAHTAKLHNNQAASPLKFLSPCIILQLGKCLKFEVIRGGWGVGGGIRLIR